MTTTDTHARGFPPVIADGCRVLVLGTLPGPESLKRQQYYAQPRNAFWRIMGDLVGAGPELPYERRLEALLERRIALWDVCHSARRPGALDADIDQQSIEANDFAALYQQYPGIGRICFNGKAAERFYRIYVLGSLGEARRSMATVTLPSTSPAHAAIRFDEKRAQWRRALLDGSP